VGYKFNQYSKNNKGCIHWRCVKYTRFKCRAKLFTFENKMLVNLAPTPTHPAAKSDIAQNVATTSTSSIPMHTTLFRTEAIQKEDEMQQTYSPLSSPANSHDMNANENELQALYDTLDPAANCKDLDETSDEEFYKRWNTSTIKKGEKKVCGSIKIV